jgi:hypothetical protein
MRKRYSGFVLVGLLWLVALNVPEIAGAATKDSANSIVITFKDGHQQAFPLADIARIEFTSPPVAAAAAKNSGSAAEAPGRHRFVGKWTVGDGKGHTFTFTFEENGQATNTVGSGGHGTWSYSNGEALVTWDDGWHDAIRKVGSKYRKYAYAPGVSFKDTPDHVADAEKSNPEPI